MAKKNHIFLSSSNSQVSLQQFQVRNFQFKKKFKLEFPVCSVAQTIDSCQDDQGQNVIGFIRVHSVLLEIRYCSTLVGKGFLGNTKKSADVS
jgi:hypothetical protein